MVLYTKYMRDWNYRSLLIMSNLLISVLSLTDLVIFSRRNLSVGIPDTWFVLGSSASASLVQNWQAMPTIVIMSQLCPKGMEATMYALLAGCHNLGGAISSYFGAYVLHLLKVDPQGAQGETQQFENLWLA